MNTYQKTPKHIPFSDYMRLTWRIYGPLAVAFGIVAVGFAHNWVTKDIATRATKKEICQREIKRCDVLAESIQKGEVCKKLARVFDCESVRAECTPILEEQKKKEFRW